MPTIISFLFSLFSALQADPLPDGSLILQKMYNRYHMNWYQTLYSEVVLERFYKDSIVVRRDTLLKSEMFPDKVRINYGPSELGNGTLILNDSAYSFVRHNLRNIRSEMDLTVLFRGAMFFADLNNVLRKLEGSGFDLRKVCETTWKGKDVYVIGAASEDEQTNQIWIQKKTFLCSRLIIRDRTQSFETRMEDYIPLQQGWIATNRQTFLNGKLIYRELVKKYLPNEPILPHLFQPNNF